MSGHDEASIRDQATFVRGRCPACGNEGTLFVGDGGYLTCSWHVCPDPCAAAGLLRERDGGVDKGYAAGLDQAVRIVADDTRTVVDVIEAIGYGRLPTSLIRAALAAVRRRIEQASREQEDGQYRRGRCAVGYCASQPACPPGECRREQEDDER